MSTRERAWVGGPVFGDPPDDQGGTGGNPPPTKPPNPEDPRGLDPDKLKRNQRQE